MKKKYRPIDVFNVALAVNKDSRAYKVKTTNINILLNKVRIEKKNDLKKNIFFLSLLMLALVSVSIFSLI